MRDPNSRGNTRFLQALCLVFPAATMAAAHWFPWRRILGRDLHRLEAYAIGTATIVGTATAAILHSDGDSNDAAAMLVLAAGSAGAATAAAYAIDEIVGLRADLASQRAQGDALNGLRQEPD